MGEILLAKRGHIFVSHNRPLTRNFSPTKNREMGILDVSCFSLFPLPSHPIWPPITPKYLNSTLIYLERGEKEILLCEKEKGYHTTQNRFIYFHSLIYATATGVLVRHTLSTTLASVGCNTLCNLRLISTKYSKVFWKIAHRLISLSLPFSVKTLLFPALTHDTRDILPMLASQSFHALTFSEILYFVASPSKLE